MSRASSDLAVNDIRQLGYIDDLGLEIHRASKPVIVRLHGILGNLLDETEHFLPVELALRGYSSINMNTLLANLGLFYGFGVIDQVIPQIDAVCDFLRELGFKKQRIDR